MTEGPALSISATELLALETVSERHFRSVKNFDNSRGAIFGGQPLVQALSAAQRTVPDWPAHNLSTLFLRAGAPGEPIDYEVEVTRDGRRFASRRVRASQGGKAIFDMLCSFHDPEHGPAHQFLDGAMPPDPDTLQSLSDFIAVHGDKLPRALAETYGATFPIELRLIEPEKIFFEKMTEPKRDYWFRMASGAALADPRDQQALLAFMSDFWFAGTAAALHFPPAQAAAIAVVTLNHSMWFHAPLRVDDWLLYRTESPWAADGRGLVNGSIHDRSGRLLASTVQEISMRTF
jgi:acyl-CoA thioesterase-2